MNRKPAPKAPPQRTVKAAPAGTVPHPRRPGRVPRVHANELMDLFEFFPDLPRVPRPRARLPIRRLRRSRLR